MCFSNYLLHAEHLSKFGSHKSKRKTIFLQKSIFVDNLFGQHFRTIKKIEFFSKFSIRFKPQKETSEENIAKKKDVHILQNTMSSHRIEMSKSDKECRLSDPKLMLHELYSLKVQENNSNLLPQPRSSYTSKLYRA